MKIASLKYKPRDFSEGQWHEMLVTLGKFGFSPAMADLVANAKSGKAKEIVKLMGGANPCLELVEDWEKFYGDLGIEADFSGVRIPERESFTSYVFVPKGMTPQKAFDICAGLFKCWKYTNKSLDEIVVHEDRSAKDNSYAVCFRDRVEADEELKGKSVNDLALMKIPGIGITERLLMEAKYFKKTGKHLDLSNWTLCSGSRCSYGGVPGVHWFDFSGGMSVDWTRPADAYVHLRSREVVS